MYNADCNDVCTLGTRKEQSYSIALSGSRLSEEKVRKSDSEMCVYLQCTYRLCKQSKTAIFPL